MAAGPSYCAAHDSRLCRVLAMVADVGKRVAQVRIRSGVLVCLLSSHAFHVSRLIVTLRATLRSDGKVRTLARTLLITNFVVLIALVGPGSSRELYLAEKRLGIASVITYSVQAWFIISTIVAAVIFVLMIASKSEVWRAQRPTKLDWALFLCWMFLVTVVCLFAFMVGMGG